MGGNHLPGSNGVAVTLVLQPCCSALQSSDLDLNHLILPGLNAYFLVFQARGTKLSTFISFAILIKLHVKKAHLS